MNIFAGKFCAHPRVMQILLFCFVFVSLSVSSQGGSGQTDTEKNVVFFDYFSSLSEEGVIPEGWLLGSTGPIKKTFEVIDDPVGGSRNGKVLRIRSTLDPDPLFYYTDGTTSTSFNPDRQLDKNAPGNQQNRVKLKSKQTFKSGRYEWRVLVPGENIKGVPGDNAALAAWLLADGGTDGNDRELDFEIGYGTEADREYYGFNKPGVPANALVVYLTVQPDRSSDTPLTTRIFTPSRPEDHFVTDQWYIVSMDLNVNHLGHYEVSWFIQKDDGKSPRILAGSPQELGYGPNDTSFRIFTSVETFPNLNNPFIGDKQPDNVQVGYFDWVKFSDVFDAELITDVGNPLSESPKEIRRLRRESSRWQGIGQALQSIRLGQPSQSVPVLVSDFKNDVITWNELSPLESVFGYPDIETFLESGAKERHWYRLGCSFNDMEIETLPGPAPTLFFSARRTDVGSGDPRVRIVIEGNDGGVWESKDHFSISNNSTLEVIDNALSIRNSYFPYSGSISLLKSKKATFPSASIIINARRTSSESEKVQLGIEVIEADGDVWRLSQTGFFLNPSFQDIQMRLNKTNLAYRGNIHGEDSADLDFEVAQINLYLLNAEGKTASVQISELSYLDALDNKILITDFSDDVKLRKNVGTWLSILPGEIKTISVGMSDFGLRGSDILLPNFVSVERDNNGQISRNRLVDNVTDRVWEVSGKTPVVRSSYVLAGDGVDINNDNKGPLQFAELIVRAKAEGALIDGPQLMLEFQEVDGDVWLMPEPQQPLPHFFDDIHIKMDLSNLRYVDNIFGEKEPSLDFNISKISFRLLNPEEQTLTLQVSSLSYLDKHNRAVTITDLSNDVELSTREGSWLSFSSSNLITMPSDWEEYELNLSKDNLKFLYYIDDASTSNLEESIDHKLKHISFVFDGFERDAAGNDVGAPYMANFEIDDLLFGPATDWLNEDFSLMVTRTKISSLDPSLDSTRYEDGSCDPPSGQIERCGYPPFVKEREWTRRGGAFGGIYLAKEAEVSARLEMIVRARVQESSASGQVKAQFVFEELDGDVWVADNEKDWFILNDTFEDHRMILNPESFAIAERGEYGGGDLDFQINRYGFNIRYAPENPQVVNVLISELAYIDFEGVRKLVTDVSRDKLGLFPKDDTDLDRVWTRFGYALTGEDDIKALSVGEFAYNITASFSTARPMFGVRYNPVGASVNMVPPARLGNNVLRVSTAFVPDIQNRVTFGYNPEGEYIDASDGSGGDPILKANANWDAGPGYISDSGPSDCNKGPGSFANPSFTIMYRLPKVVPVEIEDANILKDGSQPKSSGGETVAFDIKEQPAFSYRMKKTKLAHLKGPGDPSVRFLVRDFDGEVWMSKTTHTLTDKLQTYLTPEINRQNYEQIDYISAEDDDGDGNNDRIGDFHPNPDQLTFIGFTFLADEGEFVPFDQRDDNPATPDSGMSNFYIDDIFGKAELPVRNNTVVLKLDWSKSNEILAEYRLKKKGIDISKEPSFLFYIRSEQLSGADSKKMPLAGLQFNDGDGDIWRSKKMMPIGKDFQAYFTEVSPENFARVGASKGKGKLDLESISSLLIVLDANGIYNKSIIQLDELMWGVKAPNPGPSLPVITSIEDYDRTGNYPPAVKVGRLPKDTPSGTWSRFGHGFDGYMSVVNDPEGSSDGDYHLQVRGRWGAGANAFGVSYLPHNYPLNVSGKTLAFDIRVDRAPKQGETKFDFSITDRFGNTASRGIEVIDDRATGNYLTIKVAADEMMGAANLRDIIGFVFYFRNDDPNRSGRQTLSIDNLRIVP